MNKKITWETDEDLLGKILSDDEAGSCCGVIELGDIQGAKFNLHQFGYYYDQDHTYCEVSKPATFDYIRKRYRLLEQDWKRQYGMAVCYLLPNQHTGDFGKLIKAEGWEYHGQFWNPHTRHTLHHWSKVLHKVATKSKRKSIF